MDDEISTKLLKFCSAEFPFYIVSSMEEGIFPDAMKIVRVTPIPKAGDIKCRSNYKPISVLCALSKISTQLRMQFGDQKFLNY